MDRESTRSAKTGDVSLHTLVALFVLLVISLAGERLPVQPAVLIGLVAILSTVVVVGLIMARSYRYTVLFLAMMMYYLADQLSLPAWTDIFLVAALVVVLPWAIWAAIKEYRR